MSAIPANCEHASLITRRARANLRTAIYNGDLTLAQLLEDPPAAIGKMALVDIIRWTFNRPHHAGDGIAATGRKAVHDGINLLVSVDRASQHTLQWVGEHGYDAIGQRSPARRRIT